VWGSQVVLGEENINVTTRKKFYYFKNFKPKEIRRCPMGTASILAIVTP
jgi:hypothetical protein